MPIYIHSPGYPGHLLLLLLPDGFSVLPGSLWCVSWRVEEDRPRSIWHDGPVTSPPLPWSLFSKIDAETDLHCPLSVSIFSVKYFFFLFFRCLSLQWDFDCCWSRLYLNHWNLLRRTMTNGLVSWTTQLIYCSVCWYLLIEFLILSFCCLSCKETGGLQ